jgi:hypothetical protein
MYTGCDGWDVGTYVAETGTDCCMLTACGGVATRGGCNPTRFRVIYIYIDMICICSYITFTLHVCFLQIDTGP